MTLTHDQMPRGHTTKHFLGQSEMPVYRSPESSEVLYSSICVFMCPVSRQAEHHLGKQFSQFYAAQQSLLVFVWFQQIGIENNDRSQDNDRSFKQDHCHGGNAGKQMGALEMQDVARRSKNCLRGTLDYKHPECACMDQLSSC
jgi:hypothetical protein